MNTEKRFPALLLRGIFYGRRLAKINRLKNGLPVKAASQKTGHVKNANKNRIKNIKKEVIKNV